MSTRLSEVLERVRELTPEELKIAAAEINVRIHRPSDEKRKQAIKRMLEMMHKGLYTSVDAYTREELNDRFPA